MTEFTNKQLQERYRSLPEDLKDAIFSEDVTEHILSVGKEYRLSVDQTGELADETGLVFLGITRPAQYVSNLAHRLGVKYDLAAKIGGAINEQIFRPVRESLKKINGIEDDRVETEKESAVTDSTIPAPTRASSAQPSTTATQTPQTPEETSQPFAPPGAIRAPVPFIPPKISELVHSAPQRSVVALPPAPEEKKEKERVFEQLLKERKDATTPLRYEGKDPYREPTKEIEGEK